MSPKCWFEIKFSLHQFCCCYVTPCVIIWEGSTNFQEFQYTYIIVVYMVYIHFFLLKKKLRPIFFCENTQILSSSNSKIIRYYSYMNVKLLWVFSNNFTVHGTKTQIELTKYDICVWWKMRLLEHILKWLETSQILKF